LQRLVDLRPLHQPARQGAVERRQGQRAVLEHLDEGAAGAEENHRPELAINRAADDQLVALVLDHLADGDALEGGGASLARDADADGVEGGADGGLVGQVEDHAADVALVGDGAAEQLEDHREADLAGRLDRLLHGAARDAGDHRQAVGGEQLLGLGLGQQRAALFAGDGDDLPDALGVGPPALRHRLGDLVQQLLVAAVLHHVQKGADGRLRRVEGRHAGLAQHVTAGADAGPTQPAAQQRLVRRPGERRHLARRFVRIGHRLRGEQHQQALDTRVLQARLDGDAVALRRRVAEDVDRVGAAPVRR
jgi:hypothetical protein